MRKQKHMFVVFVALALLLCTGILAGEPKQGQKLTATDSMGQTLGPSDFDGQVNTHSKQLWESEVPFIPRDPDRTWWPYTEKIGDYRFTSPRVEEMRDSQINVNGVAIVDIENVGLAFNALPKDLILESGEQLNKPYGFYLIKIEGRTRGDSEIKALTDAGVILGEYLSVNTYIAKIPSEKVGEVKSLPFVSYLGDYHPAYKISPEIGLKKVPATELYDESGNLKPWKFDLTLHQGADVKNVLENLSQMGIFVKDEDIHINEYENFITIETMPEGVVEIAKIPEVKWIDEKPFIQLHASSTSPSTIPMLLQNNWTFTTSTTGWKLWNAGIDGNASGTAQIIAIQDTGLNTNMHHFAHALSNPTALPSTSHRKVVGYYNSGGDLCVLNYTGADGGHGTWVAQHAAGSISNMASPQDTTHTPNTYYDNGIAKDAKIYFQDIGNSAGSLTGPTSMSGSITNAQTNGAYIQSNSWGTSSPTYDTNASAVDSTLYSNPNMVVTVSAGNSGPGGLGTIGAPSTAKNCINVGGVDAANPTRLYEDCSWDGNSACSTADAGSSQGPVSTSNRIKPDICSIFGFTALVGGENEAGNRPHAMCQTDPTRNYYWDYTNSSGYVGTSFAAPEVAGLAALVRDYFVAGYYPTGTATPANAITPSGSLVKAVLLASAEPLANTAYPSTSITVNSRFSNQQGYGRVNLPSVLRIGAGAPYIWVKNNVNLAASSTHTYNYSLKSNSLPLRVMLVWYDAAGNAIQKDLDLEVQIGSDTYYGNVMTNNWSVTGGAKDHTNNTEGVFINTTSLPPSGTVSVKVIGYNNPGGENYSLVVSGDVFDDQTQITLDQSIYNCAQQINIAIQDTNASGTIQATLVSKNSGGTTIDTEIVNCTGGPPIFTGSIMTSGTDSSGVLYVVNGGSITATYVDTNPSGTYTANATVNCVAAVDDGGFIIDGGCDNYVPAFDDSLTGPAYNSWVNEYYNSYMDRGEYSTYTFGFVNRTGRDLTDAYVHLSFSGAGAPYMTVYNSPVYVGSVPNDTLAGAAFQVYTATGVPGLTSVNLNFDVTSPADGYTTANTVTQTQLLAANDTISRQNYCQTFTGSLGSYYDTALTSIGGVVNPWIYVGNTTVKGENRTDGICYNSTRGAAVAGGSGTATNFALYAWSYLARSVPPVNTGNAPNGQPWYYAMKLHAFYGAQEAVGNTTGIWGAFYYPEWNNAIAPVADDFYSDAPWAIAYYYHTAISRAYTQTAAWDWETANTGTPDVPASAPPNQWTIRIPDYPILATSNSYWAWAHLHASLYWFTGSTLLTRRDIGIDNDLFIYDQFYAIADTTSCSSQVGQVSFDKWAYYGCPNDTATISVLDGNATSPITVTVVSGVTGDSEVVTLTGTAPYFSGTLNLSTNSGIGNNNGTLYVSTADTITATYTDTNPSGQTQASAYVECPNGDVVYYSNTIVSDNGDNDGWADNNETVTMDITIQNNMGTDLTNAVVYLFTKDPNIACIIDGQANYGTVTAGTTATNPSLDRFQFQVAPTVQCTDWMAPPTGLFDVVITGDGFYGSVTPQQFSIWLDVDTIPPVSMTYTQNFDSDPGWLTGTTPDDDGVCPTTSYVNNFHWCANCGNAGAGYGAWVGDSAFGTAGQNYSYYDSSTLYSPVFTSNGNPTLSFSVAYRTEATYDGAIVQYKVGAGSWTNLGFTTPAQGTLTTSTGYCSPLASGISGWTGTATGTSWTTTNAATVTAAAGESVQFRWRLGSDSSVLGATYGGYGVDNITITNLQKTWDCEDTRNTGLPDNCGGGCTPPSQPVITNITDNDACAQSGITITFTSGSPATRHDLYRDSSLAQSNVTSPISYNPGDTSSHSYVIRAINGDDTCYTDSASYAFTDEDNSVGTPTISSVTDVDPCATSGVSITWGAVSGATGYDLRVDGVTIVTDVTSPYTYTPGDNTSHNYEVRAKNASCTGNWSTAVAGTDADNGVGTPTISSVTDVDPCATSGVSITWGAVSGATGYDLRVDGATIVADVTSPYTYTPGDNSSHNYEVRAKNASCTGNWSTAVAGTDEDNGVGTPTISSVADVDPCATSGVSITWGAVSGATGYDLRVDGGTIVTDVTSPYTYQPGDNSSHNYEVRAKNASCTGNWSTAVAGTDADNSVGTPTISSVTDVDPCATSGVSITWGAVSGATGYDLRVDGVTIVTNVTSPYTYTPGDNSSHNYEVRAKNATCTGNWSTTVPGTDANGTPSAPVITSIVDIDPNNMTGIQVNYTAGAPATQHDLYKDGNPAVANYVSGSTYLPGDTLTHSYVVRAINGSCYTDSAPVNGTDAESATPPPEVATGTNYTWPTANQTTQVMGWNTEPLATGYRVYRGVKGNLGSLCDVNTDFCTRYDGTSTQLDVTADDPATIDATNRVVYYLITAYNVGGEGPAGNTTSCGARQVNTTGDCP